MTPLGRIILQSQNSPFIALLVVVGGLAGSKDVINWVMPGDVGLYLIILLFLALVVRNVFRHKRMQKIAALPAGPVVFNPFVRSGSSFDVWPRDAEAKEIVSKIQSSEHSHLIVSGPSGAGKSTLVANLVLPTLEATFSVRLFRNYDSIFLAVLEGASDDAPAILHERRQLQRECETLLQRTHCRVKEVFEPGFDKEHPLASEFWSRLEPHFVRVLSAGKPKLYVFDQIERYFRVVLNAVEDNSTELNGYELFFLMSFVRLCRQHSRTRTLFVIRADNLYESVDFLEAVVPQQVRVGQVNYFLCPGINSTTSVEGVAQIRDSFRRLGLSPEQTQKFDRICGLDSRSYSNTFLTQMTGYVIEHFYAQDAAVRGFLNEEKDRALALRHYFAHFLNDFAKNHLADDSLDIAKVVLFCVATENRATGRAASLSRIAGLAHMPAHLVEAPLSFSISAGILVEEYEDGQPAYRFIHDLLSDYVIENEKFTINPVLKEGIRGLSDTHVPTDKLTKVTTHAHLLGDWGRAINPGLVAIWIFFVFGLLKFRIEGVCDWSARALSAVPLNASCEIVGHYYLAVYLMHCVWLIFIYHVHRDYLRYVIKSRPLRTLSASMPVVGALLAVLLSQSPTLSIVPIVSVGAIMGVVLLLGSADGSFIGRDADVNRRWGVRTIMNMVIASISALFTWLVFWPDPTARGFWDHVASAASETLWGWPIIGQQLAYGWIYLFGFVMIYFWAHIRPEQQSRLACAARLASYDRARSEPGE